MILPSSNDDVWHIYSSYGQVIGDKNSTLTRLYSKQSELHVIEPITICHEEHIITLQDNMNLVVLGVRLLELDKYVPLISYDISNVYSKMVYMSNITSLTVISRMLSSDIISMEFHNHTNISYLPNEYCLTSASTVQYGVPRGRRISGHKSSLYSMNIVILPIPNLESTNKHVELCFDFKGGRRYMDNGDSIRYLL